MAGPLRALDSFRRMTAVRERDSRGALAAARRSSMYYPGATRVRVCAPRSRSDVLVMKSAGLGRNFKLPTS
jgi:hypothetical protein